MKSKQSAVTLIFNWVVYILESKILIPSTNPPQSNKNMRYMSKYALYMYIISLKTDCK